MERDLNLYCLCVCDFEKAYDVRYIFSIISLSLSLSLSLLVYS